MMSNSTFSVSLVHDMNLYAGEYKRKGSTVSFDTLMEKKMREEYHLTPKDGNIQSDVVLLNGTPLELTEEFDIPELKPLMVDTSSPINVRPDSIVFVHLKHFNAPACA